MLALVLLLLLVTPAMGSSCGEEIPHLPPCDLPEYVEEECILPDENGNGTVRVQCTKSKASSIYQSWQFWVGLMASLGILTACITTWRCIRYCKWYQSLKDSIRHEQNRVCARCCIKYCCRCNCCVKCCEPYTRPSQHELQVQREMEVSVPGSRRQSTIHSHHHLHVNRRHSECVHPDPESQSSQHSGTEIPAGHTARAPSANTIKRPDYRDRTLEDVCLDGIHIS